jgi:NTE family protein
MNAAPHRPCIGLVMGGGGARAGYQAGVLKAIAEMVPQGAPNPFAVICGASAGSINATVLAAFTRNFHEGVRRLTGVWEHFEVDKVFRADAWSAISRGGRWVLAFLLGGIGRYTPPSVLDNTPLRELLERHIAFDRIDQAIASGDLRALCVTACSYTTGRSVSFFQGAPELEPWSRARRLGRRARIRLDHLMASTAIPIIFPAVKLPDGFYGDGSVRQIAPLAPAIHLGARRIIAVSMRAKKPSSVPVRPAGEYPATAEVMSLLFNAVFLDSLDVDAERLDRINRLIDRLGTSAADTGGLKKVDLLMLKPSRDLGAMSHGFHHLLPATVRRVVESIGGEREGSLDFVSYMLFDPRYTDLLVELGYEDTLRRRAEIEDFLDGKGTG